MKAAVASFQFTGSRHDFHHSVRSDSTFHSSWIEANGSMHSRSGGAPSSRLIHAQPPHNSHLTETRLRSSAQRLLSSNTSGRNTKVFLPSRPQHHPWNGHTRLRRDPCPSTSFMPRWRQEFSYARTFAASTRTTMTDWSRISYSAKSPALGISSSRHAICHTRGQNSSVSRA